MESRSCAGRPEGAECKLVVIVTNVNVIIIIVVGIIIIIIVIVIIIVIIKMMIKSHKGPGGERGFWGGWRILLAVI